MGKHRIYEIAKELGKSNQEVIDVLAKNNIQVKSLSTVDDAAKEMVCAHFPKSPLNRRKSLQRRKKSRARIRCSFPWRDGSDDFGIQGIQAGAGCNAWKRNIP